ncbi:hypothetical protein HZA99_01570 [Candidatus Woesearchaeota archaeon]|nr:hypothetical protein [Candidatus Woesearchaeota archaeon]
MEQSKTTGGIKISTFTTLMRNFWKVVFFLLLSILILFFTSCTPQTQTHLSNEDFWTGSDGLSFSFIDENPPETVYEETPFTIALQVENLGAHTLTGFMTLSIEDDYLCLVDENNECSTFTAVDTQTLSIKSEIEDYYAAIDQYTKDLAATTDADEQNTLRREIQTARKNIETLKDSVPVRNPYKTRLFSLEGKSIFNYEGGSDIISYKAKAKSAGALSESHEVTVVATGCYEYTTTWNQNICIDTNVNNMMVFPGSCKTEDIGLTDQGAPVAITEIKPTMLPTGDGYLRPMFQIYVSNVGNGNVINKDKTQQACTATGLNSKDYNMVFLKSFVLSSQDISYDFNGYDPKTGKELNPGTDGDFISCSPNPLILKDTGNDYITCVLNEGLTLDQFSLNQAPYMTQLSVQLDYGYTLSQSKTMTIQKILTY